MEGSALDEIDLARIDGLRCQLNEAPGDRGAQAWNRTGFGNLTNQWLCLVPLMDSFTRLSSSARSPPGDCSSTNRAAFLGRRWHIGWFRTIAAPLFRKIAKRCDLPLSCMETSFL